MAYPPIPVETFTVGCSFSSRRASTAFRSGAAPAFFDGFAVAYHGSPRYTGDIDFFVRQDRDNLTKVLDALTAFGFPPSMTVATLLEPPSPVAASVPSADGRAWPHCEASGRGLALLSEAFGVRLGRLNAAEQAQLRSLLEKMS